MCTKVSPRSSIDPAPRSAIVKEFGWSSQWTCQTKMSLPQNGNFLTLKRKKSWTPDLQQPHWGQFNSIPVALGFLDQLVQSTLHFCLIFEIYFRKRFTKCHFRRHLLLGVCVGGHVLQLFVCTGSNPIKENLCSGPLGEGGKVGTGMPKCSFCAMHSVQCILDHQPNLASSY